MRKGVCVVLMLAGMSLAWEACSTDYTVASSIPAAKINTNDSSERYHIHWACGADEWSMPADSVWTIFYGSNRFYTEGQGVQISEYLTADAKRVYWASETTSERYKRASAGLVLSDNTCAIWSDLIDQDTLVVRIYRGEVKWRYRGYPDHSQYALVENEEYYRIAYLRDSLVVHRDFDYWLDRDPHPAALGDAQAYYPFNFSQAAIDTMPNVPEDDRPYLRDVVCIGDDFPEFLRPTETETETETTVSRESAEYISPGTSAEAEPLLSAAIDCGSVPVPQEVLDAREAVDQAQVIDDAAKAVWIEIIYTIIETHGLEAAEGCLTLVSRDPDIYSNDPPCEGHPDAYLAYKATGWWLFDAQKALAQLEEEHGMPLACR